MKNAPKKITVHEPFDGLNAGTQCAYPLEVCLRLARRRISSGGTGGATFRESLDRKAWAAVVNEEAARDEMFLAEDALREAERDVERLETKISTATKRAKAAEAESKTSSNGKNDRMRWSQTAAARGDTVKALKAERAAIRKSMAEIKKKIVAAQKELDHAEEHSVKARKVAGWIQ